MAMFQLNLPQQQPKRDALDRIAQGLQIAQGVFQIPVAIGTLQEQSQNREQAAAEGPLRTAKLETDTAATKSETKRRDALLPYEIKKMQAEAGGGKPTGDQSKAALFAKRMEQAESVFSALVDSGFERAGLAAGAQSLLPSGAQSGELQQQGQAERNFVNAVLRRESGAAISPKEFSNAEAQYFPRAGDSAETVEQKKQNRALAIDGLRAEAGNVALDKIPLTGKPPIKGAGASGGKGASLQEQARAEIQRRLSAKKPGLTPPTAQKGLTPGKVGG
jgi:hypothetical protein